MPNPFFRFKQFTVHHDRCAMKVTTDGCLFGAWAAADLKNTKGKLQSSLDIGCGTGLLSLMVAQQNAVSIDAIEIDEEAAQQAKENIAASPWKDRIYVIHDNVLDWQSHKKYDCIFSNPPFYESELRSLKDQKNVAHHDAGLTLVALFRFIGEILNDDGVFYLLLPAKRENELAKILAANDLHLNKKIVVKQSVKHQPFRLLIQGRKQPALQVAEAEIAIKIESGEYTPAFVALLKDYYLYL